MDRFTNPVILYVPWPYHAALRVRTFEVGAAAGGDRGVRDGAHPFRAHVAVTHGCARETLREVAGVREVALDAISVVDQEVCGTRRHSGKRGECETTFCCFQLTPQQTTLGQRMHVLRNQQEVSTPPTH